MPKKVSEKEKQKILLKYRLAYLSNALVNWCPQLGTVLANDEVKDGLSERGGYPVEQRMMKQWSLGITAYAERLLSGLNRLDWTDSMKETQRNWIGKSEGCIVNFDVNEAKKLQKELLKKEERKLSYEKKNLFRLNPKTKKPNTEKVKSNMSNCHSLCLSRCI